MHLFCFEIWSILYLQFLENWPQYHHKWPKLDENVSLLWFCSQLNQNALRKINEIENNITVKIVQRNFFFSHPEPQALDAFRLNFIYFSIWFLTIFDGLFLGKYRGYGCKILIQSSFSLQFVISKFGIDILNTLEYMRFSATSISVIFSSFLIITFDSNKKFDFRQFHW